MKTNAMKKFYLGAAAAASLGMLGSGVSAGPLLDNNVASYEGDACIAATCVDLATGGYTVNPAGGVVSPAQSVTNQYLTPGSFTNTNGTPNSDRVSSYNVVSSGSTPDDVTTQVEVTGLQNAFELYWGSIDTYNYIDFYNTANDPNDVLDTFGGADAVALSGVLGLGSGPNYSTDGYFRFMGNESFMFDKVVLRSEDGIAFEFATAAVPEPGTLALLGLGLAGLGAARRRKLAE